MANILIVDDSASMRNMVSATLQSSGHQVADADNGQNALTKAKSGSYDAVITDLNMPVMNGIDLIKNLRTLPNYKYTPMLLLTTESSAEKKAEGKQAGATGWLVKPFNPEKLLATVDRVLG
ncbi:response regulator [Oceanicoccus sagamiensis]|uniref:Response regulator n=1 Tax=Oceanicoccus sagamiensis TaxID=716816 RepID=A0A1X9NEW4_9GAMM|nr:response regulator [Oceanicoccus sagamiensis]ARN74982.1 response regulator [Oceanicoccus sagamiensis]